MRDRRRCDRYDTSLEVEYDFENGIDIQSKTHTVNVSEGGISIPINKAIDTGKKINLKLKVPYRDKEIKAVGKVVWKESIDKSLEPEENAGVQFLDMELNDKVVLIDYLNEYGISSN